MKQRTVNLKQNWPTAAEATVRLSQELRLAKVGGVQVLKVIHGYGSSGKGGAIKPAVQKMLREKKNAGMVRHFVKGEDFTPFTSDGRRAVELCPQLREDMDYNRQNDGVTIVIF